MDKAANTPIRSAIKHWRADGQHCLSYTLMADTAIKPWRPTPVVPNQWPAAMWNMAHMAVYEISSKWAIRCHYKPIVLVYQFISRPKSWYITKQLSSAVTLSQSSLLQRVILTLTDVHCWYWPQQKCKQILTHCLLARFIIFNYYFYIHLCKPLVNLCSKR